MATVRAKFRVDQIIRHSWAEREMRTVELSPVSGDGGSENKAFWEATPSGKLSLGCINLEAAEQFDLGKEYYLDLTLAE